MDGIVMVAINQGWLTPTTQDEPDELAWFRRGWGMSSEKAREVLRCRASGMGQARCGQLLGMRGETSSRLLRDLYLACGVTGGVEGRLVKAAYLLGRYDEWSGN
jgi:hypothetical protein